MALTHDVGLYGRAVPSTPDHHLAPVLGQPRDPQGTSECTFATILDALVRDRGLSNAQLGTAIAVDQSYVHRLRTGTRNPSRAVVTAICDALGLVGIERDRLLISAGFFPWGVPDDTTLWLLRQIMEVG